MQTSRISRMGIVRPFYMYITMLPIQTFIVVNLFALSFGSRNILKEFKTGQIEVDRIMIGYLIARLTNKSFMDCLQECKYSLRCQSINYLWNFQLCELNYKDAKDGQGIETRPGSVFTTVSEWTDIEDQSCRFKDGITADDLQLSVRICTDDITHVEITDCGFPRLISNAVSAQTDGIGIFSRVLFTCQEGFIPNHHDAKITCFENGAWSDTEFRCSRICGVGQEAEESSCQDCKAGTFSDTVGIGSCQKCSAGTYQNKKGQTSCKLCPLGTWLTSEGRTYCKSCYTGTYMNETGSTKCYECPDNYYQDATRQTKCLPCSINDNPCGQPYTIQYTNLTVAPSSTKKQCFATYQCLNEKQGSLLEDTVSVLCRRHDAKFHWIKPNVNCLDYPLSEQGPGSHVPCQFQRRGDFFSRNNYCDSAYEEGGWTIIQQRFTQRNSGAFDKTYTEYEEGFGPTKDQDYWIGNDALADLTKVAHDLVIFIWNSENRQYTARYTSFSVGEENYTLHISGYEAGKSDLGDCLRYFNGSIFYTKDQDSKWNCSVKQECGWWSDSVRRFWSHNQCLYCGNVNNLFGSNSCKKSRMMIKQTTSDFTG